MPPFRHHFYVDSTPRVVDVDFNAPAGDAWHTILVGGMGKGGNRYYALDVTHPVDAGVTETASTTNVLGTSRHPAIRRPTWATPMAGRSLPRLAPSAANGWWSFLSAITIPRVWQAVFPESSRRVQGNGNVDRLRFHGSTWGSRTRPATPRTIAISSLSRSTRVTSSAIYGASTYPTEPGQLDGRTHGKSGRHTRRRSACDHAT